MKPEANGFLLKEYEAIWRQLEYVWQTRNRMVVLYLVAYGAIAGAALNLAIAQSNLATTAQCKEAAWNGLFFVDTLVCLPRYFVVPATIFLALISAIVSMLAIRFHSLASEYTSALNGIRAAFVSTEPRLLEAHLLLPRGQAPALNLRVDFGILFIVNVLGGFVIAYGLCHFLNWPDVSRLVRGRGIWRWSPGLLGLGWVLGWCTWYILRSTIADLEIARRLRGEASPSGNRLWQWFRKWLYSLCS